MVSQSTPLACLPANASRMRSSCMENSTFLVPVYTVTKRLWNGRCPLYLGFGKPVTPTAKFRVQLKPGVEEVVLQKFNRKHGVEEVRRRLTYSPTLGGIRTVYTRVFQLSVTAKIKETAISAA